MFNFPSPIFNSLSPNAEKDDILLALKLVFEPWKWKKGRAVKELEENFKNYLGIKYAFAFTSGRTALLAILQGLGFEPGSEILLQAFTCNAAVNPILKAGLKPVFVDIEKRTLNMDPVDLERKITSRSRTVIVQQTFGLPADLEKILAIAEKGNLVLVEDCAHSLGAVFKGRKLGTFGKAAFFSLGRDKVISSVFGGVAVTSDSELAGKIAEFQKNLQQPACCWILRQLLHPLVTKLKIMPLYRFFGIGRYGLIFLQKAGVLSKAVSRAEKKGELDLSLVRQMPNALALLGLRQLAKLEEFNSHRQKIAENYYQELQGAKEIVLPLKQQGRIYWRFPLILKNKNTDFVLKKMRRKKIFLDDGWRKTPIVPPDTLQEKMAYKAGSCPNAEWLARHILNLPTHINISPQKATEIVGYLKEIFYGNQGNQ